MNTVYLYIIYSCCVLGFSYGILNAIKIFNLNLLPLKKNRIEGDKKPLIADEEVDGESDYIVSKSKLAELKKNSELILAGANEFLKTEYLIMLIFILVFGLFIFFFAEHKRWVFYTTSAFVIGALTSLLCGFIGMRIATVSNYRVTYSA
jgi:hypothetical protein